VTRGTDSAHEFVVIFSAVEFAFVFVTVASFEFTATLFAAIMLWMHALSCQRDVLTDNRLLAAGTDLSLGCWWQRSAFTEEAEASTYSLPSSLFAGTAIDVTFILLVGQPD
jgi:hypothetical protein